MNDKCVGFAASNSLREFMSAAWSSPQARWWGCACLGRGLRCTAEAPTAQCDFWSTCDGPVTLQGTFRAHFFIAPLTAAISCCGRLPEKSQPVSLTQLVSLHSTAICLPSDADQVAFSVVSARFAQIKAHARTLTLHL